MSIPKPLADLNNTIITAPFGAPTDVPPMLHEQAPHGPLPTDTGEFRLGQWVTNQALGFGRVVDIVGYVCVVFPRKPGERWFYHYNGRHVSGFGKHYDITPAAPEWLYQDKDCDSAEIKAIKKLLNNSDLRLVSPETLFAMLLDCMLDRSNWVQMCATMLDAMTDAIVSANTGNPFKATDYLIPVHADAKAMLNTGEVL